MRKKKRSLVAGFLVPRQKRDIYVGDIMEVRVIEHDLTESYEYLRINEVEDINWHTYQAWEDDHFGTYDLLTGEHITDVLGMQDDTRRVVAIFAGDESGLMDWFCE